MLKNLRILIVDEELSPQCLFSNNAVTHPYCDNKAVTRHRYSSSSLPLRRQFVTCIVPHDSRQLYCSRLHLFCCDPAPS